MEKIDDSKLSWVKYFKVKWVITFLLLIFFATGAEKKYGVIGLLWVLLFYKIVDVSIRSKSLTEFGKLFLFEMFVGTIFIVLLLSILKLVLFIFENFFSFLGSSGSLIFL
jgi:hypothetical protein